VLLGAGVAVRLLATLVFSSAVATGRPLASMEQAFLAVAWLPKATVQAALAGLAYGYAAAHVPCGGFRRQPWPCRLAALLVVQAAR